MPIICCYAVIGNPIAHSYSPKIHKLFAKQSGFKISYKRILASKSNFSTLMKKFWNSGGHGINVTIPFKELAFRMLCESKNGKLSDQAYSAGAINTITLQNDKLEGDNTDGLGLVKDLLQQNFTLKGARILLVGAGGAAKGVLKPLANEGCSRIHIVNRTHGRAQEICNIWNSNLQNQRLTHVSSGNLDSANISKWDLIINATSSSLYNTLPILPRRIYSDNSMAYDMVYSSKRTPFLEFSINDGASRCSNGLGMLVAQAAESFFIWHGIRPSLLPVMKVIQPMLS